MLHTGQRHLDSLRRTTVARLRLPRLGDPGDVLATVREGQRGERARQFELARRVVALQRDLPRQG
jgi:hypothetical protein